MILPFLSKCIRFSRILLYCLGGLTMVAGGVVVSVVWGVVISIITGVVVGIVAITGEDMNSRIFSEFS